MKDKYDDYDYDDLVGTPDKDGWWKECIRRFLPEMILRMIPELYYDADFTKEPKFLSQELRDTLQIPDEHQAAHYVDELVEIQLKNGECEWVLLHIEVQGKGNTDISWRMMLYCCLIFAHYHKMPVALAIMTDKRPKKETPGIFEFNQYGTHHTYVYNLFEVYKQKDEDLFNSDNPFDLIIYVAKKYKDYSGHGKEKEFKKFSYLREVTKLLANKGWNEQDRRDLLILTARIISLKNIELQKIYTTEVKEMAGGNKMAEMTFIEKFFRDEGRAEGIQETIELMTQYGVVPEIISQIKASLLRSKS